MNTRSGTHQVPFGPVPAPVMVVAGIFSLQFGAAFARLYFADVGPVGATLLRLLFSSLILIVLLRPRIWRWSGRAWLAAVLLGVAIGGMNQLIYLAVERIPLGVAITIEFLGPLALALIRIRRPIESLWAVLALGGVALLGAQAITGLDLIGVLFALAAGACWAGYILASANLGKVVPGTSALAVSMFVAAIVAVPLGAAGAAQAFAKPELLWIFLLVAIMSSVVPYAIELRALRVIPIRVFSIIQSMGPGASAIAGLVLLHQHLRWQEMAALILVTVASIGVTASNRAEQVRIDTISN